MNAEGSVTRWIPALKKGDEAAAQKLWEKYCGQLMSLARQKLPRSRRGAADEEDIVQSAFNSFFQGLAKGRFPQLADRHNLVGLLVVITARKAADEQARQRRKKRGGDTKSKDSRITTKEGDGPEFDLDALVSREPTPEFAAQVAEQCELLLERLGDDKLRRVALWKMEGFTNAEIAEKLQSSLSTVNRKLDTIRIIWDQEPLP